MYYLPSSWKTPSFTILNDLNTAPSSNMECESGGMDPENDKNKMRNLTMILHFVLSQATLNNTKSSILSQNQSKPNLTDHNGRPFHKSPDFLKDIQTF